MSGLQNKLDSVRDSIASLFKRRKSRSKNGGISTPQNVKRIMHITFNSDNQSFNGIPNQWRQYFEGNGAEEAAALRPETEEKTAEIHGAVAGAVEFLDKQLPAAEIASVEPLIAGYPDKRTADYQTEGVADSSTAEYSTVWSASMKHLTKEETTAVFSTADSHDASAAEAETTSATEAEAISAAEAEATSATEAEPALAEADGIKHKSHSRARRELLSLVYDRDHGQFVNLPPHWEERLRRNNLLEPEFQNNPKLLAMVFSLMDQELRSMRAEGERVESCLYSSLPRRQSSRAAQDHGHLPNYVFRIEADKSNSSSDWDLTADHPTELMTVVTTTTQNQLENCDRQKGSFVTVKAVEVPEELDSDLL